MHELSLFLESGCDGVSVASDGCIRPGENILSRAETGLSADVLLLLLSPASTLARWPRERWEEILFTQAEESGVRVGAIQLEPCAFPELFRRKLKFFDASPGRVNVFRRVKRWIQSDSESSFSPDLEALYRDLADRPGIHTSSFADADRFALEAAGDFEAVCRIPAGNRTLAQIAGALGVQLGMALDGPVEDNCRRIGHLLSGKRCLVIFDSAPDAIDPLMPSGGRTSFLLTTGSPPLPPAPRTLAAARSLVHAKRFAEAYELLRQLLHAGIEPEFCARDLVWICDHWGRHEEAGVLRAHFRGIAPSEQLSLF